VTGHFIGLNLARRYGHKIVSLINMLVFCGSFYIASSSGFVLFLIFMGFVPGICIGNEYLIPVDNGQYFYPQRKVEGIIYRRDWWGVLSCVDWALARWSSTP
jgi:hypothetical protein